MNETIATLEAQLARAEKRQLDAQDALSEAQLAFDSGSGSDADQRTVAKFRQGLELADDHVARATRLLQAERERAETARVAELRRRIAELDSQLSVENITALRAPGIAVERDALLSAACAYEERFQIETRIAEWERERRNLDAELSGQTMEPVHGSIGNGMPVHAPVEDALDHAHSELGEVGSRYLRLLIQGVRYV